MRSRPPCRPTLAAACRSFSTSSGIRYSRERREAFEVRRGGIAGEGAARDLGCNAFLFRPREGTFPFWSIGVSFGAADFFEALAIPGHHTFPLAVLFGKDGRTSTTVGEPIKPCYYFTLGPFCEELVLLWLEIFAQRIHQGSRPFGGRLELAAMDDANDTRGVLG